MAYDSSSDNKSRGIQQTIIEGKPAFPQVKTLHFSAY